MLNALRLRIAKWIAPKSHHVQRTGGRKPKRDPVVDAMVALGVAAFNSAKPGDFTSVMLPGLGGVPTTPADQLPPYDPPDNP